MKVNPKSIQEFSNGRPCVPVDDNNAVQEEQTVLCPEAYSIKYKKSPGGTSKEGLDALIIHETPKDGLEMAESSTNVENLGGRNEAISKQEKAIRRLQTKTETIWKGIGKKQGIRISTFNMKGRNDKNKKSKWPNLATIIRKQRILIMGVQETHLNEEETEKIKAMCPKIELINNGNSTKGEGVAFIINKELANKMKWTTKELIKGKAMRMNIEVEEERRLDIVVIHAPNNENEKIEFFKELKKKIDEDEEKENVIILGDFNSVENEIDRFPHRKDEQKITEEWKKIKKKYKLIDRWRVHNEQRKEYTFIQPKTNSMSRIDRIYLNENIYPYAYNWIHIESARISDHEIVIVDILKKKLPFIGKGIWRMYQDDLENTNFKKESAKLLKKTLEKIEKMEKENEKGIQKEWMKTKEEIKKITKEARKTKKKQLEREKEKMKKKLNKRIEELEEINPETERKKRKEIKKIKKEIAIKTKKEIEKLREMTRARYRNKGEKYTKYWFKINKEKINSNIIIALQNKEEKLTTETKEMKEIALEHHKELQKKPEMTTERKEAIEKLKKTTKKTLSEKEKTDLKKETTYEEIKTAIKKAPNGTSPGIDGIIYEFYKEKIKENEENEDKPDIVKILHIIIKDIEKNGIEKMNKEDKEKDREFTDGVMHLLFKKKEKWKIENYRPITLLNTDYKIYTKTIAIKLANVAKNLIHEDQAGFVPERSLYDHTKTTHMVIEYCEIVNQNGCIIALDQEKAYDKIDHEYLWEILEKYEFPREFIERIKELYKDTGKAIIMNGVLTKQYKVKRGVHQGDPMSCLLYNFAIEPLAEAIRKSKLKGIKINEKVKRLIVSLFADDTLIYLAEKDNIKKLKKIIETFCTASTARFNLEKTEYLPIGNENFRKEAIRTRKIGENKIEEGIKIVKEGEAMRTLGAWVGNKKDNEILWDKILEKQEESLKIWKKTNMSMKGKEIILKAIIQSKAMFLATVNGMSKEIEEKMKKMFKDFIWNEKKRGLMAWNQIIAPREEGGLGIPDIRSRIEAIEIMWIKKWLNPEEKKKPKWTYILDEILKENVAKAPMIDNESKISWIKQTWHESEGKEAKISKGIRNMLRVARKYNITLEPLKFSKEAKENEPLWHNKLMTEANYQWNKKSARCIRTNHGVETIKDLYEENSKTGCSKACNEMIERLKTMIPEIINPTIGTPKRIKEKNLDLTPRRIKRNERNKREKTFNPDITAKENTLKEIRMFSEENGTKKRGRKINPKKPAYRKERGNNNENKNEKTKAKIVITREKMEQKEQEIKVKVKIEGKIRKEEIEFKLKKNEQNEERANAAAILWTLKKAGNRKTTIITKDIKLIKWIGEGITKAEDKNWIEQEESEIWKSVLNELRQRNEKTKIRTPKNKEEENEMKKMKEEIRKKIMIKTIEIKTKRNRRYLQEGAKLEKMTQNIAYKLALRKNKEKPGGAETWRRIKNIKETLTEKWNIKITEEQIWKGIEQVENPQIRDFIWKIIHNRIKCGKFFRFIPNWQEKEFCKCGKSETIEHILIKCKKSGQESLWKKVKETWEKLTEMEWKQPTLETIMGIGSIKIRNKKDIEKSMKISDIYRKLITTAIWTIWKNRNDRVFNDKEETAKKQIDRWKEQMENEIKIEYNELNEIEYKKREEKEENFKKKWINKSKIVKIKRRRKRVRIKI